MVESLTHTQDASFPEPRKLQSIHRVTTTIMSEKKNEITKIIKKKNSKDLEVNKAYKSQEKLTTTLSQKL